VPEPTQFPHQAGGGVGRHQLDEHRLGHTVSDQRQPRPRRRPGVAADDGGRANGGPHDSGQGRGVDVADRARQPRPPSQHRVGGQPTDTTGQMGGQAHSRQRPFGGAPHRRPFGRLRRLGPVATGRGALQRRRAPSDNVAERVEPLRWWRGDGSDRSTPQLQLHTGRLRGARSRQRPWSLTVTASVPEWAPQLASTSTFPRCNESA